MDVFDEFPIVNDGRIVEFGMRNAECGIDDASADVDACVESVSSEDDGAIEIVSSDEAEIMQDYPDLSTDIDIEPKFMRMVDFYLTCGNKKKAAKLAGIEAKNDESLRVIAARAFKRPEVKAYYKLRQAELARLADIKFEAYMSELVSIATLDIADVVESHVVRQTIEGEPVYVVTFRDINDIPAHARKAVKQIKINKDGSPEMIFYDKLQALKLLGEIKGYLTSAGVSGEDGDETGIVLMPEAEE